MKRKDRQECHLYKVMQGQDSKKGIGEKVHLSLIKQSEKHIVYPRTDVSTKNRHLPKFPLGSW